MYLRMIGTLSALALCASAAMAQQTRPIPQLEITGPIPVTAESGESYRGSNEQPVAGPGLPMPELDKVGYIQEEYFISGTVDGKSYLTSLLVRKPKDMSRFSGLVGVETIHAQGAIPFWGTGREVWAPGNHGWVAVASQFVALEQQVKRFNPRRYATLRVPQVSENPLLPPGQNAQDQISQAIMTQVGAFLKSNGGKGPFAGATVKYLLMGGASQTGGTTISYIQQSHAGARMPDGKPIYDGYWPGQNFSLVPLSGGDAAVIHLVGEGDFQLFSRVTKQPGFTIRTDSDAPYDRYREYEIVGSSHVPTRGSKDGMKPGEMPNQFPTAPIYKMGLIYLIDWVTKGVAPPHVPLIERKDGAIVRDEYGNARGGLRSPYVDVPTAHIIASAPLAAGDDNTRAQRGIQENFPADQLKKLYKTRDNYLKLFNASMDKLVAAKMISAADAQTLRDEEAKNPPL